MDLSIIIVSYNTKHLLDRCLHSVFNSLQKTSLNYEVIVVDNNSIDGSVELLDTRYKQVKKILNKENLGFGKANNQAIKHSIGEYIFLLNSDCIVQKNAIETLLFYVKNKEKLGSPVFAGGKLLNEDGSDQASCGPFYSLLIVFIMLFFKGDALKITRYSPKFEKEVDWISGACIMTKRATIDQVFGFDEEIFMYMEEIDLLYRAKQQGIKVYYSPDAVFVHTGAASSGSKKEPVVNIYKGLLLFYKKHHSPIEIKLLRCMLRVKAWLVMIICGIIHNQELITLYAKADAALE